MIAHLTRWKSWVIYIGAGASVDRTGLTWRSLVDQLLEPFVPDADVRTIVIDQHGEQRAATVACTLYGEGAGYDRISNRIRDMLYGAPSEMSGRLLEHVAALATTLYQLGIPVALVTPNFDSHLLDELRIQLDPDRAQSDDQLDAIVDHYVAGVDDVETLEERAASGKILVVSLHGFVPATGAVPSRPVISELDYHQAHTQTSRTLQGLFAKRNVLLLGTSLVDPPLLEALHVSRPTREELELGVEAGSLASPVERVALLPLQGPEWRQVPLNHLATLMELSRGRLGALGVSAVFTDFFIQVGQFVHEVNKCIEHNDAGELEEYVSDRRYGSRLETWWRDWSHTPSLGPEIQARDHERLVVACDDISRYLGAPASESLKLEVWVRWRPQAERSLCLWASSVGTWPDIDSMRKDTIGPNSAYRSVQVFCNGATTRLRGASSDGTRWQTYLAVPIWYDVVGGSLPVGVVSLASMRDEATSALNSSRPGWRAAIKRMQAVGAELLDPRERGT